MRLIRSVKDGEVLTTRRRTSNYMNIKFRKDEIEKQFREYAERSGKPMNTVVNEVIEEFFRVEISESDDRLEKFTAAILIINSLPWRKLPGMLSKVRENPLNRSASMADLCLGIFDEGLQVYEARYQGNED